MKVEIIQTRLRNLRRQLAKQNLDGLILTQPVEVAYVTAFAGHDSWAFVTKRSVYLLTDSRYTEQAEKECLQTSIVERQGTMPEAAGKLVGRLKSVKNVAIDASVSVAAYEALKKSIRGPLKAIESPLATLRSVKDGTEKAAIENAIAIATEALKRVKSAFKPGITEIELAGRLDLEIRRLGSQNSFETIVAFGANASRPHHQPSQRKLRKTDTILIDFGARYEGYCSDITRCFAVGKPPAAYRRAYEIVRRAQAAAMETARAGVALAKVDAAARTVIRESGLPVYGHGTGHGIGLDIHEKPFLKENAEGVLQTGQILTIEPGVYLPGKFGIRCEDDILVTETDCQILTKTCPHDPLPA